MHNRLASVLRERTEFLKSSVDKYLNVESKTLKDLKDNLELELANIKVSITDSHCYCRIFFKGQGWLGMIKRPKFAGLDGVN